MTRDMSHLSVDKDDLTIAPILIDRFADYAEYFMYAY